MKKSSIIFLIALAIGTGCQKKSQMEKQKLEYPNGREFKLKNKEELDAQFQELADSVGADIAKEIRIEMEDLDRKIKEQNDKQRQK